MNILISGFADHMPLTGWDPDKPSRIQCGGVGAPVTDLHLLDGILQTPLLLIWQPGQTFEWVVHRQAYVRRRSNAS